MTADGDVTEVPTPGPLLGAFADSEWQAEELAKQTGAYVFLFVARCVGRICSFASILFLFRRPLDFAPSILDYEWSAFSSLELIRT